MTDRISKIQAQNDAITAAATGEAFVRIVTENREKSRIGLAERMAAAEKAVAEEFRQSSQKHES